MKMEGLERRLLMSGAWRLLTQRTVLPWVLRFADLPERADVLEIGSGAGFEAEALLDRFPGWRLVATDYDEEMVALASARVTRFGERVRVEQADATMLSYLEGAFDLIVAIFVWHHLGAWEGALTEARRVLRDAGQLLLVDVLEGFPIPPLGSPGRMYGLPELRAALSEAGFARWRVRSEGALWYRLLAET